MGLTPFQKGAQVQPRRQTGTLKPFTPVKREPIKRKDPRDADNYRTAVQQASRTKQEAEKASSFRGMAGNVLKGLPKATYEVLAGTPAKFVASAVEAPRVIASGGKTSQREYKLPGLTPFKSYQSDFKGIADDVISGKKGLGSAAWGLAQVPLAGAEVLGIGGGLSRGLKAFQKAPTIASGVKKALPEVADAFVPIKKAPVKQSKVSENIPEVRGGKQRGFIKTVKGSEQISEDLSSRIKGNYEVKSNVKSQEKAQQLIFNNVNEAERVALRGVDDEAVLTGNELIKHYDKIAVNAKAAGNMQDFNLALDKATEIVETQAKQLTEAGRTIQAASTINKLSPEGILKYVNSIVAKTGAKIPKAKTFDFMRKAEEIQGILDPKARALKTFDLIDEITEGVPRGKKDLMYEVLNLPRAIMATADLSAPMRQGIFVAVRNPKIFAKNFKAMFKYAFSEDAYRNFRADIVASPNYDKYMKHNLALTDVNAGLTGREEEFMSTLAEKIPIFGQISKGSNRAYTGFLNKMRVDLFDNFVETAKLEGLGADFLDDAATFVGSATGRGKLGAFEESAKVLNTAFFSPRLAASRINLINPFYYSKLHPTVRKEAFKTLATFVGAGTSVLMLAKMNGAEVGDNPRSADFGKIKVGNTRYDIWGGFQQYARLIGQLTTGEKISTISGRQTTLGEGFGSPTRESIFMDFIKSKESPILSFVTRIAKGEQFGEKPNIPAEVIERFIPMVAQDAFDLIKENGATGALMATPAIFGVGSQTYGGQVPKFSETKSGRPSIQWQQEPGIAETIVSKLKGEQVSNIPQEDMKALQEEKKAENLRKLEIDKTKAAVLATGKAITVGDTEVYLEDGIIKTKKIGKDKRTPIKDRLLLEKLEERKRNPFYQN